VAQRTNLQTVTTAGRVRANREAHAVNNGRNEAFCRAYGEKKIFFEEIFNDIKL
jgi:hypothetical protein